MRKWLILGVSLLIAVMVSCTNVDESDVSIKLNPGIDTVEINSVFIDEGATSKAFGFPVANEVISNTVNTSIIGTYEIIYEVSYKSIVKQIIRMVVVVVDETSPVGLLNKGIDTIFVGQTWIDSGVTTNDNSLSVVSVIVSGEVLPNYPGEYIIEYLLTDETGNQSIVNRYVTVLVNPNE